MVASIDIRRVMADDVRACHAIERQCFPPAEAASEERIRQRQQEFPEGFLVATDHGVVVGFVNSAATSEPDLSKEEFKALVGHDPAGRHLVILSIAVTPGRQGEGLSRRLLEAFVAQARAQGRESILLLCKAHLLPYYKRFGFRDLGRSASTHGGVSWHEMRAPLQS